MALIPQESLLVSEKTHLAALTKHLPVSKKVGGIFFFFWLSGYTDFTHFHSSLICDFKLLPSVDLIYASPSRRFRHLIQDFRRVDSFEAFEFFDLLSSWVANNYLIGEIVILSYRVSFWRAKWLLSYAI